jgi:hypothetical protein
MTTDGYPDVIRHNKKFAEMEAEIAQLRKALIDIIYADNTYFLDGWAFAEFLKFKASNALEYSK